MPGKRVATSSSCSVGKALPVGLLGEQIQSSFVRLSAARSKSSTGSLKSAVSCTLRRATLFVSAAT